LTKEKYVELRKKRLKEREERFRIERERIRQLKEKEQALRLKKWSELVARRREIERSLLEKTRLEEERREKAKGALCGVKKALEEIERKASIYVPETMKKINEMLMDADKSFESTDYEKTFKLSHEITELLEKARLEALKKAEEKGKYFYCVIPCNEEKSFGQIGMNDEGVYTIPYRDIAAVVSDSPVMDYEMTEDNIRRHEAVLRQVMECHTVVPVEFGTTIKNEKILGRLLTKAYEPTRECLRLVDNMVELGVKVVLNGDIVFADIEKRKENASDILASLSTIAKQAVAGDLFSDRLILNTSFLVNKKDIEVFSNEVARLQEKYPMFKLLYSGPWPPHNFVYIKIGTEGMEISKR